MREGRQNEGDDTGQPAAKVVRLPRDWLGPREELVPFGRQPIPRDEPDHATSAADFWGEGAAAVHDALQAPVEDAVEDAVEAPVETPAETPPGRTAGVAAPAHRRVLLASGLGIAAAVIAALASVAFGVHGSPSHPATGARLDMAAVFSGGLSRMLQQGVAIAGASATASGGHRPAAPRRRARVARRTAHRHSVLKPAHERTQPSAPVNQSVAASPDVARATPPSAPAPSTSTAPRVGTSEASITPARHTSSPAGRGSSQASRATVNPTGESGALGPVQSPNG